MKSTNKILKEKGYNKYAHWNKDLDCKKDAAQYIVLFSHKESFANERKGSCNSCNPPGFFGQVYPHLQFGIILKYKQKKWVDPTQHNSIILYNIPQELNFI